MKTFTKYILIIILIFNALFVSSQNKDNLFVSGKIQNINNNILEITNVKPIIGLYDNNNIKVFITDSISENILTGDKTQYINNNILIYIKPKNNKFFLCRYKDSLKFQKPYLTPTNEPFVILDTMFLKDTKYHDFKKMNYELNRLKDALNSKLDDKLSYLSDIIFGTYRIREEYYYYDFIREYAIWEYYEISSKHYCYDALLYGDFYTLRNIEIPLKYAYIIDKLLSPPFNYKPKETISLYIKFINSEEDYLVKYGKEKLQEALVFFQEDIKINKQILENLNNL